MKQFKKYSHFTSKNLNFYKRAALIMIRVFHLHNFKRPPSAAAAATYDLLIASNDSTNRFNSAHKETNGINIEFKYFKQIDFR